MNAFGTVELILSAILINLCVVFYFILSGWKWTKFEGGRHVMSFMLALSLVLDTSIIGHYIDRSFVLNVQVLVFALIPFVFGWRLLIIIKALVAKRREGEHDSDQI